MKEGKSMIKKTKNIILGLTMVAMLVALASCSLIETTTIEFVQLPQAVYDLCAANEAAEKLNEIKTTVKVKLDGKISVDLTNESITLKGLDQNTLTTAGKYTLSVTYKTAVVLFEYSVVEVITEITTEEGLRTAVANGGKYKLTADIRATGRIEVKKPIIIYGNNHSIIVTEESDNGRAINFNGEKARDLNGTEGNLTNFEFYDLKIESTSTKAYIRGVSIYFVTNANFVFDNCTIIAPYYAFMVDAYCEKLDITLMNGTVSAGWAAINSRSNNSKYTIKNTTLIGKNDRTGESNNFATIVFDGCKVQGLSAGAAGQNNIVNISNSTVISQSTQDKNQFIVTTQYYAANNVITFSNCNITQAINSKGETSPIWTDYESGEGNVVICDESNNTIDAKKAE